MTSSLSVRELTFCYPGVDEPAVADVDLLVEPGAMTAVIGPSGSGKSTVLRLVAGLTEPDGGEVEVGGRSVLRHPPERRGMTMMFQQPHLFPHLTVLDNVAFAGRVAGGARRETRRAARRYLELVHLGELAGRRTRQLSGGQEQRVALARALAAEPEVLLLDEPFSALDAELRASMHRLLLEVRAALGPTIVMVTHDMAEAALADRVAVLVDGRIVQEDVLPQLYAAPAALSVARVLGGFSEVPGRLTAAGHRSALGLLDVQLPAGSPAEAAPRAATMVLRQERVQVAGIDDPLRTTTGVVAGVGWVGARQVATVTVAGRGAHPPATVRAEVALGATTTVGRTVGLQVDPRPWCLPDHPDGQGGQEPARSSVTRRCASQIASGS